MDWSQSLQAITEIAGIVGGIISLTAAVVWWFARHTRISRAEFGDYVTGHDRVHGAIDDRLAAGERRFGTMDGDIKHRPAQSDLTTLRDALSDLSGAVRELRVSREGIEQRLGHMEQQLDRLIDFQLTNGK